MITIIAANAPDAYIEAYWSIRAHAKPEKSRNGPVLAMPSPVCLEIANPLERVITDPVRNANPFFHVMETIWMFAGSDRVGFPAIFNGGYVNYAEAEGHVHGAYGKRWRDHFQPKELGKFKMDQIQLAIAILKKDPESRQVVIGMWDPASDLGATVRDRPCNTHIYFRARDTHDEYTLDMTVCNRSNDLVWGMLGANVVHMTYLHELIAHGAGMDVGMYRVLTNNLHVYTENEVAKKFLDGPVRNDPYVLAAPRKLLQPLETAESLFKDCEDFVNNRKLIKGTTYITEWMNTVAKPMYMAYDQRIRKDGDGLSFVEQIAAEDWRLACRQWIERKTLLSATSTGQ